MSRHPLCPLIAGLFTALLSGCTFSEVLLDEAPAPPLARPTSQAAEPLPQILLTGAEPARPMGGHLKARPDEAPVSEPSTGYGPSHVHGHAPASLVTSVTARQSAMSATGYAVISVQMHAAPAQQRLLAIRAAKLDAYRVLTEQVYGQYLDATTTVADMVVKNDTFRARVEGVIYGATLVSITPVGEDTYEATLSLDASVVADLRRLYIQELAQRRDIQVLHRRHLPVRIEGLN